MTAPIGFIDRVEQGQDDATKAVLDLAFVRDELTPAAFDRILSTFTPDQAVTIRAIADDLRWALDLRSDPPHEVLTRYYGPRGVAYGAPLDRICDGLAEEREADAVRAAQLVASLLQVPARTAPPA